ncbi:MAG: peptide chain release factor N(5)-glutamine methyltransferase [Hyphomicrobiaceae bacterium]|nr:peptide chain release factor N(5)-glutamine methyltransferase [Hyphomicrobiaceae bacterium]
MTAIPTSVDAAGRSSDPSQFLTSPIALGTAMGRVTAAFREAGLDSPGLDARRLVCWALALDGAALWRSPEMMLGTEACARLASACRRRLAREPVSRIVGARHFHGLELEIGKSTLDPRPETETLVDGVLDLVAKDLVPGGSTPRILDLGTGSGAILIALLARLRGATGLGTDISDAALATARRNATRHGIGQRAEFRRSSWLAAVDTAFDIVVSNPPYIARHEIARLAPEVREHDPLAALDGGTDGIDAYRAILAGLSGRIARGGWLVLEVGDGQAEAVAQLVIAANCAPALELSGVWTDLSGIRRCVAARARS